MAQTQVTTRLKKLINTPETEVKDAMAGMAAAHSDLIRVEYDRNVIIRKDAPQKGEVGPSAGRGRASGADARRVRRARHARRGLSGRGLHLAHTRPDGGGDEG